MTCGWADLGAALHETRSLAGMCYFKGYLCTVAQKKDVDFMPSCWISCIMFLAGRDLSLLRVQLSTSAFLYSSPLMHWEEAGPVTPWPVAAGAWSREGGERGCPRATLLSGAQSLKWCCWEALFTKSHIPQALPRHATWCTWESTEPNRRVLERNLRDLNLMLVAKYSGVLG